MRTGIQKWGNSLALRIPKSFAEEMHVAQDVEIELSLIDGKLVAVLLPSEYSLEDLLGRITTTNLHRETETGEAVGGEIW